MTAPRPARAATLPVARRRFLRALALAPLATALPGAFGQAASQTGPTPAPTPTLDRIRARGALRVALYDDMPPFHDRGRGIDVELARLLARDLGVGMSPLPFPADDKMEDDLRNMVWKGHYLGYGPADVLLHVPVERPLMTANPQVRIFGPYCRERVAIARDLRRVPKLDALADLGRQAIAVPGQSLAGWLLLGADGGAYRQQLSTSWKDGTEAARALQRGEVAASAALSSELESVLAGDERFEITPLPLPRGPLDGWAIGMAVKQDAADLAAALQASLDAAAADGRLKAVFATGGLRWPRT